MPIHVLLLGIGIFVAAVCTQILVWNIRRISRPMTVLPVLLIVFPTVGIGLLVIFDLMLWIDAFATLILLCLLSSAYIQSYPIFQEDIPSFRIMLFVRDFGTAPFSEQVIIDRLDTDDLFVDKLQDLIDDGLIVRTSEGLILTRSGQLLVIFFSTYRRWLGLNYGVG